MDLMIEFSIALLGAVADFLAADPVFYLFSIFCLLAVIKVFRALCP